MWSVDCRYCWWWLETGECVFNCFLLITLRRVWPRQWPLNCGVTRHVPTRGDVSIDIHVSIDVNTWSWGGTLNCSLTCSEEEIYTCLHITHVYTRLQAYTRGHEEGHWTAAWRAQKRRCTRVYRYTHAVNALFSIIVYSWHLDTSPWGHIRYYSEFSVSSFLVIELKYMVDI